MFKNKLRKISIVISLVIILSLVMISTVFAGSATKVLSSNFTLVNIGANPADVIIEYFAPDGSPWLGSIFTNFTLPADGGQQIVRQYEDQLTSGQGSVVISSSEALGSVVQELNRSGIGLPTSGAYKGFSQGSNSVVIPQLARKAPTAVGMSNSVMVIQNTGGAATTVTISFYTLGDTTGTPKYVTPAMSIEPGASKTYDLYDVSATNLPDAWWGTAVVNAAVGGEVAVVVNWFSGPDGLNVYEGVPSTTLVSKWFIPLLYIRLTNTLTTSVAIQNISGVEIPAADITISCKKDASSGGSATLSYTNTSAFPDKSLFAFNFGDTVKFPEGNWYGGCVVSSATNKNMVVLVTHRYLSGGDSGSHLAIPGNSTDKTVYVPLIAKRLSNGFSTGVSIQNLNESATATVTLTYTQSNGTVTTRTGVIIPAGGSIIRNFRLSTTESPELTDGWVGTLKIVSSDQPIQAYIVNSSLIPGGDQFYIYTGISKP